MLAEISKLRAVRAIGLPSGLFADVAAGVIAGWRARAGGGVTVASAPSPAGVLPRAMAEGAMHHATTMSVEGNYSESHGQSEVGFGITRLLGFDLLPRIKRINKTRLYRPGAGEPDRTRAWSP